MTPLNQRIEQAADAIRSSDAILIGGGAGLSAAAGITYSGPRFERHFADFIKKYGFTDMYSASFHPFRTEEERWAQWARHALINRFDEPPAPLYARLLELVRDKPNFVLTTNVESQFEKAGFAPAHVFEVQGNYGLIQCAHGCHDKVYPNEALLREMAANMTDCRIPASLVPKCPVCGGPMDMNLRKDAHFVEDVAWHAAAERYSRFLAGCKGKSVALLELGVGFNTPGIIRFPFERFVWENPKATLIRMNRDYPGGAKEIRDRTVAFDEEMGAVLESLIEVQSETRIAAARSMAKPEGSGSPVDSGESAIDMESADTAYSATAPSDMESSATTCSPTAPSDTERMSRMKFLIRELASEIEDLDPPTRARLLSPETEDEAWRWFRSLVNLRRAAPADEAFLEVQDALLRGEIAAKGITDADDLERNAGGISIWRGDITTLRADAIVNAANADLRGCFHPCHGCIDNAIHTCSGVQLREACDALMNEQGHPEPTGRAKITPGFNLPAGHVLHTVGPIVEGRLQARHKTQLADCYRACLDAADAHGLESVAFCCISTGEYRFPNEPAAEIAIRIVRERLPACTHVKHVVFNVFTEKDEAIYRRLLV